MKRALILFSTALLLGACASAKETRTPDGQVGYSIDCTYNRWGSIGSWSDCFQAAGDKCGDKGYVVLDRSADQTASAGGAGGVFGARSVPNRSMLIRCKD